MPPFSAITPLQADSFSLSAADALSPDSPFHYASRFRQILIRQAGISPASSLIRR
jgi:hypothetical protein